MLFESVQFSNSTKCNALCVACYGVQALSYLVCIMTAHENVTVQAGTWPRKVLHLQQLLD